MEVGGTARGDDNGDDGGGDGDGDGDVLVWLSMRSEGGEEPVRRIASEEGKEGKGEEHHPFPTFPLRETRHCYLYEGREERKREEERERERVRSPSSFLPCAANTTAAQLRKEERGTGKFAMQQILPGLSNGWEGGSVLLLLLLRFPFSGF